MAASATPVIDYGARLRAGVLIPSGNSVAEPELRAMQVAGTSLLVTRLALRGAVRRSVRRAGPGVIYTGISLVRLRLPVIESTV